MRRPFAQPPKTGREVSSRPTDRPTDRPTEEIIIPTSPAQDAIVPKGARRDARQRCVPRAVRPEPLDHAVAPDHPRVFPLVSAAAPAGDQAAPTSRFRWPGWASNPGSPTPPIASCAVRLRTRAHVRWPGSPGTSSAIGSWSRLFFGGRNLPASTVAAAGLAAASGRLRRRGAQGRRRRRGGERAAGGVGHVRDRADRGDLAQEPLTDPRLRACGRRAAIRRKHGRPICLGRLLAVPGAARTPRTVRSPARPARRSGRALRPRRSGPA